MRTHTHETFLGCGRADGIPFDASGQKFKWCFFHDSLVRLDGAASLNEVVLINCYVYLDSVAGIDADNLEIKSCVLVGRGWSTWFPSAEARERLYRNGNFLQDIGLPPEQIRSEMRSLREEPSR